MAIVEKDNEINIKLPDSLIEDSINFLRRELEAYSFKDKIEDLKSRNVDIIIDPSDVKNIDFFGYQHLYGFCFFIKKVLSFSKLIIKEKSGDFSNFEKKYGLFI